MADLRITENVFQNSLLEFFEQQRMVVPVARVRWPRSLVVKSHDGIPEIPPTAEERSEARALETALRRWAWRDDGDPEAPHPFDLIAPPGASLIETDLAATTFEPWNTFRTNIQPQDHEPIYSSDAVDTYYHDWQALLVADAIGSGIRLIFDTTRPEIMKMACDRDFVGLESVGVFSTVSFQAPRGLTAGKKWSRYFDAVARAETVRERKLSAISSLHSYRPFLLEGAELDQVRATAKRAALTAIGELAATREQLIEFLRYLAERWDEWTRDGRPEIANEYKRQLRFASILVMDAFDIEFTAVAQAVGRVTGHFVNTLDAIFPDWTAETRSKLETFLKGTVLAKAPRTDVSFVLDDADVGDLLDWLERRDSWKLHLSIEEMSARRARPHQVDPATLARETESISTSFEHIINDLLHEAGLVPSGTLMPKVVAFWREDRDVYDILRSHTALVGTGSRTRSDQLRAIASFASSAPRADIARVLLRAVLYRNDGLHNGMSGWSEEELLEASQTFLTALLFCRKNLLLNPPKP